MTRGTHLEGHAILPHCNYIFLHTVVLSVELMIQKIWDGGSFDEFSSHFMKHLQRRVASLYKLFVSHTYGQVFFIAMDLPLIYIRFLFFVLKFNLISMATKWLQSCHDSVIYCNSPLREAQRVFWLWHFYVEV